MEFIPILTGS